MARKTAMGKEPGNVSIALPQSEKDRFNRTGKFQPGDPTMANKMVEGANPKPLRRLSPGVYRNNAGQLVGSKGQALPGSKQQSSIEQAVNSASNVLNNRNFYANQQQGTQQPMSQQDMDAAVQAGNLAQLSNQPIPQGMPYSMPSSFPAGSVDEIMRNRLSQMPPGNYPTPQGQQFPIQNLIYTYPNGKAPDMNALRNYGQQRIQQQQQPQTVSGLLQRNR